MRTITTIIILLCTILSGAPFALSADIAPDSVYLRGMRTSSSSPLEMDFLLNRNNIELSDQSYSAKAQTLIKYFLAALTIPEDKLWVNLAPDEPGRIMPEVFSRTLMGRDMLAQDHLLKQIAAETMSPEHPAGAEFWSTLKEKANREFPEGDIPIETLSRVWIVPDYAKVVSGSEGVVIVESRLKVLTEDQYTSDLPRLARSTRVRPVQGRHDANPSSTRKYIETHIIPEIEDAVNNAESFSELREIYHALILATWYKKNLLDHYLQRSFAGQQKTRGLETPDPDEYNRIYDEYVRDFKEGVYVNVLDEYDSLNQSVVSRKYFTGGVVFTEDLLIEDVTPNFAMLAGTTAREFDLVAVSARLLPQSEDPINSAAVAPVFAAQRELPPDAAMINEVTDITRPLGTLQHDDDLVLNYPLKLAILDILKANGLPVSDGLIIDARDIAESESGEELAERVEDLTWRAFENTEENLILRSLDDDVGTTAGIMESYIVNQANLPVRDYWKSLVDDYGDKEALLARTHFGSYTLYYSNEQLLDLMRGVRPNMRPIHHMGLVQKVHPSAQSGVITSYKDRVVINYIEGMFGAGMINKAKKIVIDYQGNVIFNDVSEEPPPANLVNIAGIVRTVRSVLYHEFNISGREWVIEYGANLFDADNLNMEIFQVRSGPSLTEEETVDTVAYPEIFRFGPRELPINGEPVLVRNQEDLIKVKRNSIVVVRTQDIDAQKMDFSKVPELPAAILTDGGSRSQHAILNVRFLPTFSARPDFFEELVEVAEVGGFGAVLTLNRSTGKLEFEVTDGVSAMFERKRAMEKTKTSALIELENYEFTDYASDFWVQAQEEGYTVHPDRKADELVLEGEDRYFKTKINGVGLLLPPRKDFLVMSNEALVEQLVGPLRYAFSIYENYVFAFPYYGNNPEGKSHTSMNMLYNRIRSESESSLEQRRSVRAWNFEGGKSEDEALVIQHQPGILVLNTFGGDDGVRPTTNPQELMEYLKTLSRIGVPAKDVVIRFDLNADQRMALARAMVANGLFAKDFMLQVLGYKSFELDGTTYVVNYQDYRRASRFSYRSTDDIWKRVLNEFAEFSVLNNVNPLVEIRPGVILLSRAPERVVRDMNTELFEMALEIGGGPDAAMLAQAADDPIQADRVGGINLNPQLLDLEEDIELGFRPMPLINGQSPDTMLLEDFQGLSPFVYRAIPVSGIQSFLGLK